jgi:hypothetical protein
MGAAKSFESRTFNFLFLVAHLSPGDFSLYLCSSRKLLSSPRVCLCTCNKPCMNTHARTLHAESPFKFVRSPEGWAAKNIFVFVAAVGWRFTVRGFVPVIICLNLVRTCCKMSKKITLFTIATYNFVEIKVFLLKFSFWPLCYCTGNCVLNFTSQ